MTQNHFNHEQDDHFNYDFNDEVGTSSTWTDKNDADYMTSGRAKVLAKCTSRKQPPIPLSHVWLENRPGHL